MRHLFLIFFAAILSVFSAEAKSQEANEAFKSNVSVVKEETGLEAFDALDWQTELSKAFELAKNQQKNVIVMVEDIHCKWCVKMKKGALSDRQVQKILKRYILVKVLRSDKSEVSQLNQFDGTIPNFFFMTKNKETVDNIVGYFTADDFLGYIKEIKEDGF